MTPNFTSPAVLQAAAIFALGIGGAIAMAAKTAYQRRPKETPDVFGDARFMNDKELRQSGLLVEHQRSDADGIYIGSWTDQHGRQHYLRDVSDVHVLLCGPTRSGKGVGCIVPTLLSFRGAAIINDEKGELYEQTAAWRAENVGPVAKWEPGALSGSDRWNPLSEIRLFTPHEIADAQNIALMLIDVRGHGLDRLDHWQKAAVPLLTGMVLYESYDAQATSRVASLGDLSARFAEDADSLFEEMKNNKLLNGEPHWNIAAEGAAQLSRSDRERAGVTSTLRTFLTLFADPIVCANTAESDFRLDNMADGEQPTSIYITNLPVDTVRLRPLARLFLTMAIRALMTPRLVYVNEQAVSPHRHRTLMALDEFPSFGKLEEIEAALARCASWGIKFLLSVQDITQLNGIYGLGHSIIANCHTKVYFPTNDLSTAEALSRSTGTMTANTPHTTIMGRRVGFMSNVTRTIQPTAKALMTPGEILAMKAAVKDEVGRILEPGWVLIFMTGWRVLKATQLLHFQDPAFVARAARAA